MNRADRRARRWAAARHGVLSREELRRAGLSDRQISRRVAAGELIRLHRAVYLVNGAALTFRARLRAALLACGSAAAVSHRSATALWGLVAEPSGLVEVSVIGRNSGRPQGVTVHRPRLLPEREIRVRDGLRCTSPVRSICDLAGEAGRGEVEHVLQEAAVRRLVTDRELRDAVRGMGRRPGASMMRAILAVEATGFTRSWAERRLAALLEAAGLPQPSRNVRIAGHVVDAVWPAQRLILEIDGIGSHGTAVAFTADRARDAELLADGWRVIRITALQLRDDPLWVVGQVGRLLPAPRT